MTDRKDDRVYIKEIKWSVLSQINLEIKQGTSEPATSLNNNKEEATLRDKQEKLKIWSSKMVNADDQLLNETQNQAQISLLHVKCNKRIQYIKTAESIMFTRLVALDWVIFPTQN